MDNQSPGHKPETEHEEAENFHRELTLEEEIDRVAEGSPKLAELFRKLAKRNI